MAGARLEHEGSTALVTGGASGIGAAVAELLASEGATVAIVDRDEDLLAATSARIAEDGARVMSFVVDVNDLDAMRAVAEQLHRDTGALDVLVASAGIQRYGDAVETTMELWDEVMSVNVTGVFVAAKACLPFLRHSKRGAIVVVSSVQGLVSQRGVVAYAASKGALNSLTRALAVDEAKYGVRVNAVCPGSVDTPMLRASARLFSSGGRQSAAELAEQWGRAHPLGRLASPAEVAAVVGFLAGARASFVTGEDVRVDGGLLASIPVLLPGNGPA